MFQEFPYSDMHQLNLDWIIKIAKDFLDQYTHIQQLIEDGETSIENLTQEELQALEDKAAALEAALQVVYNQTVNNFNNAAQAKGDQVIADIPADYTDLANAVAEMINAWEPFDINMKSYLAFPNYEEGIYPQNDIAGTLTTGKAWKIDGTEVSGENYCYSTYTGLSLQKGVYLVVTGWSWGANYPLVTLFDSSDNIIKSYYTVPNLFVFVD